MLNGDIEDQGESIVKLIDVIEQKMKNLDGNLWRDARFFQKDMETMFKSYIIIFKGIFEKNCSHNEEQFLT
jgi:hypothetical protein